MIAALSPSAEPRRRPAASNHQAAATRVFALGCGIVLAMSGCSREAASVALPAPPTGMRSVIWSERLGGAEHAVRAAPRSAAAWMQLGRLYQANGFASEARICYEQARAHGPDDPAALQYLLAVAADASGDAEAAERALQESLRSKPAQLPALIRLGELRYKAGDATAATEHFRAALALDENCPEALLALARDQLRQGADEAALDLLVRLQRSHPEYGSGLSLQAQLLERRGRREEADALRRQGRVRKDPPMADPLVEALVDVCVDVTRLGLRFEDALNAGRIDEALASLDRMAAIEPRNWLPRRLRGFALAHTGRVDEAVTEYRRALELGGDPAVVYPGLVSALVKLERWVEAEQAARTGLGQTPKNGPLLVMLAELTLRQGRREDAAPLLEQALAADDRDLAAHRALARLKAQAGDADGARKHWTTVVQLDPTELPGRVLLAQHHLERNEPSRAIAPLTEARAIAPDNSDVRHLLALAWLRRGNQEAREKRFDDALASYARSLEVEPASIEARTNQARLLAFLRRFDEATVAVQPLLSSPAVAPAAYLLLGDIERASGRPDAAEVHWRRAAELVQDRPETDPIRATVIARLRSSP